MIRNRRRETIALLVADVRGLNLIFISVRHKHNDLKWLLSKKKAFSSSI